MRSIARLIPLALAALALCGPALADTVYVYEPTAYYVPSRYVATGSYIPTSYVLSTTSYVVPTSFVVPTSYVVRRYRPTVTYAPTTYYLPTTLNIPLLTSTAAAVACCDPAPTICDTVAPAVDRPVPAPASASAGSATNPDASGGGSAPALDPNVLNSTPRGGTRPGQGTPQSGTTTPSETDTTAPLVPPPADNGSPPIVPPAGSRDALKPLPPARGTLSGRVLSETSGQPEKGVEVTFANAVGRFRDRTATTDDQGRFSVVLPEGDWTVKVARDGGGTFDQDVTIAGGLITDEKDRAVSSLTIKR
jgi:hypothetical protein